jgi:hypothetical protein
VGALTEVPLFEVVLRFPDRDEVRITDREGFRPGETVVIESRRFRVVETARPSNPRADERFVLEPEA